MSGSALHPWSKTWIPNSSFCFDPSANVGVELLDGES